MSDRWFERAFGERYVQIYAHRDAAEAARALDTLWPDEKLRGRRALDLACGDGRYLKELRRRGARAVGLDLSPVLLRRARAAAAGPVLRGDMRTLPFGPECFDLCLSMFTSFGYFETFEAHRRLAAEMGRVTREEIVVDVVNPGWLETTLVERSEREVDGLLVREERWLEDGPRRVCKRMELREGARVERYEERVMLFGADQLRELFGRAGFAERSRWGGYGGEGFDGERSPRLILRLEREVGR